MGVRGRCGGVAQGPPAVIQRDQAGLLWALRGLWSVLSLNHTAQRSCPAASSPVSSSAFLTESVLYDAFHALLELRAELGTWEVLSKLSNCSTSEE